jgi:hypothetical protein
MKICFGSERYRVKSERKKRRRGERVKRRRIPTYQLSYQLERSFTENQRWPNNMEAAR